jgi:hypothetical protein
MSVKSGVQKRERSLAELVVIVILITLLMANFIVVFMDQNEQIKLAGFKRLANNFSSKVTIVHGQWLMDLKPKQVVLSSLNDNELEYISVNKKGWIDTREKNNFACRQIWQLVFNTPMQYMQSPISAIEVNNSQLSGRVCRYNLTAKIYFEYHSDSGKIISPYQVLKENQ